MAISNQWNYAFFLYYLADTVLIVRITLNCLFQAAIISRARQFQNFLLQKSHFFSLHSFREAFNCAKTEFLIAQTTPLMSRKFESKGYTANLRKLQLTILSNPFKHP